MAHRAKLYVGVCYVEDVVLEVTRDVERLGLSTLPLLLPDDLMLDS